MNKLGKKQATVISSVVLISMLIGILIIILVVLNLRKYDNFVLDFNDYNNFSDYNHSENDVSKIFVINLQRRPDRLQYFTSNYKLDFPYEIFNAVDGKQIIMQDLIDNNVLGLEGIRSLNTRKRKYHYELTNLGAVGCYLSHYYIWKYIIDNDLNQDNYLIFEDDSELSDIDINLGELNYRISKLPKDWDMYLLISPLLCYNKKKYSDSIYKVDRFFCTHAYVINKKGIMKIFNTGTIFPINQQIDSYLGELSIDYDLNIYVHNGNYNYYPQRNLSTDIQNTNENQLMITFERYRLKN